MAIEGKDYDYASNVIEEIKSIVTLMSNAVDNGDSEMADVYAIELRDAVQDIIDRIQDTLWFSQMNTLNQ